MGEYTPLPCQGERSICATNRVRGWKRQRENVWHSPSPCPLPCAALAGFGAEKARPARMTKTTTSSGPFEFRFLSSQQRFSRICAASRPSPALMVVGARQPPDRRREQCAAGLEVLD